MILKYVGGRPSFKVIWARKHFIFSSENDMTLDIKQKEVINYIFSLPNRSDFELVEKEPLQEVDTLKKKVISPEKGK